MTTVLRAFPAFLRAGIGTMLQYRGEILLWAIWGLVNPLVLYAMWTAAATGAGGSIAGYSRGELAAYFFAIMIIGHVSTAWDTYEMGFQVRTGKLSPQLLRPILPIWAALANNVAYKIATLAFLAPMWTLCAFILRPQIHAPAWQIAFGVLTIAMAGILNFIMGYTVALIAFWTPKLDAVGEVYFGVAMFLGGRFAPLAMLPNQVYWIAKFLPFRWMFGYPAEVISGRITDPTQIAIGFLMQCAWLAGLVILFRIVWEAAVRRYTAVSG